MPEKDMQRKSKLTTILWGLVIVCMLVSLPLIYERYHMEGTAKNVEVVFDYRDLLDISMYRTNPSQFINTQLDEMKKTKITSLAVYESTLNELMESGRIALYSSHDAAALAQRAMVPSENFTYVLFKDKESQAQLQNIIQDAFSRLKIKMQPWTFNNQQGLIIELPLDEASLKPMDPDPITMQMLIDRGFHLVIRLSNRRPFVSADMDKLLTQLADQFAVKSMIVDGDGAPGYSEDGSATKNIEEMGRLMLKHHMSLAIIEPLNLKVPQKGVNTLAKAMNYQAFRLHSLSEQDSDKLSESITNKELNGRIRDISDRFVLAVKERNIRMILLNARANKNLGKASYADPLEPIYRSLKYNADSALYRIQNAGYKLGEAEPFNYNPPAWEKVLKPFAVAGSVALIALLIAAFFPTLLLPVFVIGLLGSGGLYVLSPSGLYQSLALGVGVSAVSLAIIKAIQTLRSKAEKPMLHSVLSRLIFTAVLFARTVVISGFGAIFIVSMLNEITYNLVIQQFKGVNVLAFAPLLLAALYLLFYSEKLTLKQKALKLKRMLTSSISVIWIVSAIIILGVSYYYLSRTGNGGTASSLELTFRSFLENTLKVRPRTKEFLIGNPLLILGIYLCLKHRLQALYLVLIGAIGQASIVGTFTHLHTPLQISIIRAFYGLFFGALIALVLIVIWEICARGWNKWTHLLRE
ncbi:MAG: hypothetical protein JWM44_1364 [Bacilli bacterium]|nr:hypothetical protein [Bacilli bacterium]